MKKIMTHMTLAAFALMAATSFSACSNSDDSIIEDPIQPEDSHTYTMTIEANIGGDEATTRALSVGAEAELLSSWKKGDQVEVYSYLPGIFSTNYTYVGTLTAQTDGSSTTLSGEVTLSTERYLKFYYHGPSYDYSQQSGSLEDIAAYHDLCIANLGTDDYQLDFSTHKISTWKPLEFYNQQAIVNIHFYDSYGSFLYVSNLTIENMDGNFNVAGNLTTGETTNAKSINVTMEGGYSTGFTVAVPNTPTGTNIRLTVRDMYNNVYTYMRSGVKFIQGKYYEISVKFKNNAIDLSTLTSDYTAKDGDYLIGKLQGSHKISIADGATVTLFNADINSDGTGSGSYAGITCNGDATINLIGENKVKGFDTGYPGIATYVGSSSSAYDKMLTICGTGSLTATGQSHAAGIGSGGTNSGRKYTSSITISGGTVTAIGGEDGAGIGTGRSVYSATNCCGDILITGGTVTATGGDQAAGIGTGYAESQTTSTPSANRCGTITITNTVTKVTAIKGGFYSIGIGKFKNQTHGQACGTITIGNTVYEGASTKYTNTHEVMGMNIDCITTSPYTYQP